MDITEKKRKLEAIRAAREEKQRVVDQYTTAPPPPPVRPSPSSAPPAAVAAAAAPGSRHPSSSPVTAAAGRTSSPKAGAAAGRPAAPAESRAYPPMPQPRPQQQPPHQQQQQPPFNGAAPPRPPPSPSPAAPRATATAAAAAPAPRSYRDGMDSLRGWSRMLDRGGLFPGSALAEAAAAGLTLQCALTPKLCLGREGRVPVDVAVTLLPYRREQQQQQQVADAAVDSAVCVAAAYSAGATNRDSVPALMRDGTDYAATGYPWGSAAPPAAGLAAPGGAAGSAVMTVEAVSRAARRSPGLALAWTVIPGSAMTDGFATHNITAGQQQQRRKGGVPDAEDTADGAAMAGASPDATADLVVLTPLVCDAELSCFTAHPFRPGVFIAGTRTGRIVMWQAAAEWIGLDRKQLRARAMATTGTLSTLVWRPQRPCASSFPSPAVHQAPVLRLAVHGDPSNHHVYSIAQDGKMGTWPAWQPTQPVAFRTSYLGSKAMGPTGTAAAFAARRGSDAMTRAFVGTVGGAVLEGVNRDSRVVELTVCGGGGGGAGLGGSSSDATASAGAAARRQAGAISPETSCGNLAVSSSGLGLSNPLLSSSGTAGSGVAAPRHCTPVTAVAVQCEAEGMREADCVVSAAMDGTCIAWLGDTAFPLDNFTARVTALAWSPTYTAMFAAGDEEGVVTLWNVFQSTAMPLFSVATRGVPMLQLGSTTAAAILAVGGNVAGGGGGGGDGGLGGGTDTSALASMAAAGNMTIVEPVDGAAPAVTSLTFSAEGQWLFAGTAAGHIFVIELATGLF